MDTANTCGNRLFKVDVPQAVEEFFVFNRSKKCFQHSGDFLSKMCIFCAAVVNKKDFSAVRKSHRCNQRHTPRQRKNCVAIVKDKAARLRGAIDNFLITVPLFGSFVPLVTVLFVAKGG